MAKTAKAAVMTAAGSDLEIKEYFNWCDQWEVMIYQHRGVELKWPFFWRFAWHDLQRPNLTD